MGLKRFLAQTKKQAEREIKGVHARFREWALGE